MTGIDVFLIVILIISAIKGYIKGFIVEVFSLIAFFLGLYVAVSFTSPIALKFFAKSHYFEVISIVIFLGLFIGLILLIEFIAKKVKNAVDLAFLGIFDQFLGSIFGAAKWALIISVFIWTIQSIGLTIPDRYTENSFMYPIIKMIAPSSFEVMGMFLPFFRDIFDKMEDFNQKGKFI